MGAKLEAIPTRYSGELFRSRLEADWAATLDRYDIRWIYEPEAYRLANINYLPDFFLPEIRVWVEVKSPLDQRLEKAVEFQKALDAYHVLDFEDEWEFERQHVAILRPGSRGKAVWENAAGDRDLQMMLCPDCGRLGFMNFNDPWRCRYGCENLIGKFWEAEGGGRYLSGELDFFKAPRPYGSA